MTWKFIYKNGGWWLKISSIQELTEYHHKVDSNRMAHGLLNCAYSKEFGHGMEHADALGTAIGLHAVLKKTSPVMSMFDLHSTKVKMQAEEIKKGLNVYINDNGGWHSGKNDYSQWITKDKLVFPDFKKNQIKIEKFPMGNHYYAYIDGLQVRNGDTLKWNTYEEAYQQALNYISI